MIAVTSSMELAEMEMIASAPAYIVEVDQFDSLESNLDALLDKMCDVVGKRSVLSCSAFYQYIK